MQCQHILFLDSEVAAQPREHVVLPAPNVPPLHDVFAEAMLEDTSAHQPRSPFDWIAAAGVHFAILGMLLILPLYYANELDVQKFNLMLLAPPVMPPGAPPPPQRTSSVPPRAIRNLPARVFKPSKLMAPSFIPRAVASAPVEASLPEDVSLGVPGGVPGGQIGAVIGGVLGGALRGVPQPAALVAERPRVPVLVGGSVKPPRLIYGIEPEYPSLAKRAKITGVVVIEAVIDEHGNVIGMRAISGHPLLIPAALNAVSKRKYEPTILDGDPTSVDLRVEITFRMG